MEKDLNYWRLGVADEVFLSIAIKNYLEYNSNKEKLDSANRSPEYPNPLSEFDYLEDSLNENFTCIIVFCSMFLESYIYDYSARNLGDSYATKHLDKLDLLSKWVVIPKLITGKELDKSHHSYGVIKKLISLRNKITHWKSQEGSFEKLEKSHNQPSYYDSLDVTMIFNAILDLFRQLDHIDGNDHHLFRVSQIEDLLK